MRYVIPMARTSHLFLYDTSSSATSHQSTLYHHTNANNEYYYYYYHLIFFLNVILSNSIIYKYIYAYCIGIQYNRVPASLTSQRLSTIYLLYIMRCTTLTRNTF